MDENRKKKLATKTAFGKNLNSLLGMEEYHLKKLADELGIAPSTVSKWINDGFEPNYATLIYLSERFKVSIDYLLKEPEKPDDGYVNMSIPLAALPCVKEAVKLAEKSH